MAQLTKRLGKGFWTVFHDGRYYKRKVQRKAVNGKIQRWVTINGRNYQVSY